MISHKLQLNTVLTLPCSMQIGIYPIVILEGFPGESVVKNMPVMQVTWVQSLGQEDGLEKENGNPLQYSCQGNPMVRGAWRTIVHGVTRVKHDLGTFLSHRSVEKDTPVSIKNVKIEGRPTSLWLCGGENIFVYYIHKENSYIYFCLFIFFHLLLLVGG